MHVVKIETMPTAPETMPNTSAILSNSSRDRMSVIVNLEEKKTREQLNEYDRRAGNHPGGGMVKSG